ncbi:MAG: Fic family protein [Nanoarchaeota archaeon]|nr:Fic family protein [Nanoarchaeota archaeon]
MVTKYDVFYVIGTKGMIKAADIVKALNKEKKEYRAIFNYVMELDKEGYIERDETIKVIHNEKSKKLFRLISFCISNNINYNLLFKENMLEFIQKAAKKEFFTIKNIKIHPQTFKFYTDILMKYGFLLLISKKPLKYKLLKHHFIIDLMKFFNMKIEFYTSKKKSYIKEIEKELRKYRRNLKLHYTVIQDLEKKEEVNFIHYSLNLEGIPLTLPETQKLILKKIVPEEHKLESIQAVTNYKKAVDLMMASAKLKVKLDLPLILKYHKIAMDHIHGAGEIRKQNVRIKLNPNFKTCDWKLIHVKLNELMEKYNEFISKKKNTEEVIKFASYFHNEFQRIHPFIDGNSRTSRLLMLHILRSHSIPVLDLPLGYFDLYLDLTKRSEKRDDEAFNTLIEELVLMNLKKINLSF